MIRALFLLFALVVGLTAALVTQTSMGHLRALVPDRLPGWTSVIAADAGVLRGTTRLPGWPGATLRWRARAPSRNGLHWAIAIDGGGLDLAGSVILPFDLSEARLTGLTGTLSVDRSSPLAVRVAIQITDANAVAAPLPAIVTLRAEAQGLIRSAMLRDTALGGGPFRFEMDPLGTWRTMLTLDGGAAQVEAQANGRLGRDSGSITATVTDTGTLPEDWAKTLSFLGQRSGDTWTVQQPVAWSTVFPAAPATN